MRYIRMFVLVFLGIILSSCLIKRYEYQSKQEVLLKGDCDFSFEILEGQCRHYIFNSNGLSIYCAYAEKNKYEYIPFYDLDNSIILKISKLLDDNQFFIQSNDELVTDQYPKINRIYMTSFVFFDYTNNRMKKVRDFAHNNDSLKELVRLTNLLSNKKCKLQNYKVASELYEGG